ncbi:MAG TPA: DUF4221 family protein [Cyclobacteriaceae bacterium]|nr:DUF4221 family protein [Cyclobacteriaceae bacterium]
MNTKVLLLFSFAVVVMVASCDFNDKKKELEIKQSFRPKVRLEGIDSIQIQVNNNTNVQGYVQLASLDDREYLIGYQYKNEINNFHFYDLESRQYYKTISFNRNGPNGMGKLSPFATFNSFNEIVLYEANSNRFYIGDSTGRVLRKFDLKDIVTGTIYPQPGYPTRYDNGNLYFFQMSPINPNSNDFHKQSKAECIYDTKSGSLTNQFPNYPEYPSGIENTLDGWKVARCIGPSGEFVYSFPFDNRLIVVENGKSPKHFIPNTHFNVSAVEGLAPEDLSSQMDVIAKFGLYTYIFFDPYRSVYYRIYLLPGNVKDIDGKLILIGERPFRVEIIDTTFNLIGYTDFKGKGYNPYIVLISKEGVLISRLNPHAPATEDRFIFERFSIQNEKNYHCIGCRSFGYLYPKKIMVIKKPAVLLMYHKILVLIQNAHLLY